MATLCPAAGHGGLEGRAANLQVGRQGTPPPCFGLLVSFCQGVVAANRLLEVAVELSLVLERTPGLRSLCNRVVHPGCGQGGEGRKA